MTRSRAGVLVLVGTVALSLIAGEAVFRAGGGYRLSSLRLVRRSGDVVQPLLLPPTVWPTAGADAIAAPHLPEIPRPAGVDSQWFFTDPPLPPQRPARSDLEALSASYTDPAIAKFARRQWNVNFVLDQARRRQSYWEYLKQIRTPLQVFDTPAHSQYPRYRMLADDPHAEAWSTGTFTTNNLGYRGQDVLVEKPPKTFRIVFVGASTTIDHPSFPLSFTDYVGHYLNLWAKARGLDVRFEAINTAREGLQSQDIAAVVEQELPPLSADIVVYKEGANQFGVAKQLLTVSEGGAKPIDPEFLLTGVVDDWPGLRYSAILRRARSVAARYVSLREAPKPSYVVNWPAAVDERAPDLTRRDLPLDLPEILADLDRMRAVLRSTHTDFAVSTFVWMADEDLKVNASRANERALYWYLNGNDVLWPLRYRDIRRFAEFQNLVFQRYCEINHLHLVDLARWFPRDPALFIDAIHVSYAGVKVHGWISFLQLLPLVEQRLARQATTVAGPRVPVNTSVTTVDAIEARLAEGTTPLPLPKLSDWKPASPAVRVTFDGGRLHVAGTAVRWSYQIVSAPIPVEPGRDYQVRLDARVLSGAIGVGVLDESGSTWIASPLDTSVFNFNSGKSKSVELVVADSTPQLGAVKQSVFEIR